MKFQFNKGSRFTAGPQTVVLTEDTVLEVEGVAEGDNAHLAEVLSGAHHTLYGAHVDKLTHEETVQRMVVVDGVEQMCDVDLTVSYGALAARVETPKGDPRPIKPAAPAVQADIGSRRADVPASSDAVRQQAVNAAAAPTFAPVAVDPPPDELKSDFPGYNELVAAGFTKRSELKDKTVEELEQINRIVPPTSRQIFDALRPPLTAEDVHAISEQSRADVAEAEAEVRRRDAGTPASGFIGNERRVFSSPTFSGPKRRASDAEHPTPPADPQKPDEPTGPPVGASTSEPGETTGPPPETPPLPPGETTGPPLQTPTNVPGETTGPPDVPPGQGHGQGGGNG